jgi:hypothetical protein
VRSSAYGSRFRVQGLESGNVDPMRATLPRLIFLLVCVKISYVRLVLTKTPIKTQWVKIWRNPHGY